MTEIREEKQITMSYEAWLGANILAIDRAYNRGNFIEAHLGIMTLYTNMLSRDRKGLREFVENHQEDYREISPVDIDYFLRPSSDGLMEAQVAGEWHIPEWRTIYMAMIDYFHDRGYLFKTRMIEIGDEHGIGVGRESGEGAQP